MTTRSEAELRDAADRAIARYTEADSDLREQRFLTDDELLAQMHEQASAEKALIRAAIAAGRTYIVAGNDTRRVHFHDCPSLREQVDRDRAWSPWLHGDVEGFRQSVAHGDGGPRMPQFLDRPAVEALSSYVTCQICSPTLSHVRKSRGERTTKLTSLTGRHIGRSLAALDGSQLGQLERIVTTIDAAGLAVRVDTTSGSITEDQHPAVLVTPRVNEGARQHRSGGVGGSSAP